MLKRFINRPVLSTVISIIIVTLGILGLAALPVSQYPEIAPPSISVQATYTGANADVVLKSVIVPLEMQINGVQDMDYMTSTAANDGTATIMVVFKVGTNPDIDAVNVQNLVSRATSQLPQEVIRSGITVRKRMPSDLLVFSVYSENPAFDQTFLQNYADINLVPEIKRISGVGDAVAQLYIHQRAGSASRPVRQLKGFQRVSLAAGAKQSIHFTLGPDELQFWSPTMKQWVVEPEQFDVWVGEDSTAKLHDEFRLTR